MFDRLKHLISSGRTKIGLDSAVNRSISSSGVPVYIDSPSGGIFFPYVNIWGWFPYSSPDNLSVSVGGLKVKTARVSRPDLHADQAVAFSIFLDLVKLKESGSFNPAVDKKISLDFYLGSSLVATKCIDVVLKENVDLTAISKNKQEKQKFLQGALSEGFTIGSDGVANCLPKNWGLSFSVSEKSDPISSHFYGPDIQRFLEQVPQGGFVLDAGAGLRNLPFFNVVNLEIYDYPSTDVLAIGQHLPFKDGVFDAVLSLAVLEHVDDPFRCADEIVRVLKPGGRALVMVPFLQAEHGYPSHFFNCTRFGVRKLFEKLSLESHFLEMSNHPINTIDQILSVYRSGLPAEAQKKFESMTVSEILSVSPSDRYISGDKIVSDLSESAAWELAWGTTAIFSKSKEN